MNEKEARRNKRCGQESLRNGLKQEGKDTSVPFVLKGRFKPLGWYDAKYLFFLMPPNR